MMVFGVQRAFILIGEESRGKEGERCSGRPKVNLWHNDALKSACSAAGAAAAASHRYRPLAAQRAARSTAARPVAHAGSSAAAASQGGHGWAGERCSGSRCAPRACAERDLSPFCIEHGARGRTGHRTDQRTVQSSSDCACCDTLPRPRARRLKTAAAQRHVLYRRTWCQRRFQRRPITTACDDDREKIRHEEMCQSY